MRNASLPVLSAFTQKLGSLCLKVSQPLLFMEPECQCKSAYIWTRWTVKFSNIVSNEFMPRVPDKASCVKLEKLGSETGVHVTTFTSPREVMLRQPERARWPDPSKLFPPYKFSCIALQVWFRCRQHTARLTRGDNDWPVLV